MLAPRAAQRLRLSILANDLGWHPWLARAPYGETSRSFDRSRDAAMGGRWFRILTPHVICAVRGERHKQGTNRAQGKTTTNSENLIF